MLKQAIPVLHVSDSASAKAHYCGMLGFRLESATRADDSLADPCFMGIVRDGARLHLSSFSGDGVAGVVAQIEVDDVDALHEEFAARGVAVDLAPIDQTWGNREMYIKDRDGNCLRFVMGL